MNPSPPTVLILGAAGRLGLAAAHAFAKSGWRVLAQARKTPPGGWPAGVHHTRTALQDLDSLCAEAGPGTRAVVYAINPPLTRWAQDMLPWARCGMAIAQKLDALFMLPGNVYHFGEGMPPSLTETTPAAPTTRKGQLRAMLEAEMRQRGQPAGDGPGLRSVVLRAGDFFGGGCGSWFDLVVAKSWRQGKLVYPGPLSVPHAWAYLPDLAEAFVAVAQHAGLRGFTTWHFEGHTVTGAQLMADLAHAATSLGVAPAGGFKHGRMPWPVIRVAAWVVPLWRELVEMEYLWRVPHALSGQALSELVGPLNKTPLHIALANSLRTMAGDDGLLIHSATTPLSPRPHPR